MLFMTLNLTKSLYFSHEKEKLINPNSQKSNFLLTETTIIIKQESIFVFVKFANCNN